MEQRMIENFHIISDVCPYCKESIGAEELDDATQLAVDDRTNVSLVLPCEACGEIIEIFVDVVTEAQVSINKV